MRIDGDRFKEDLTYNAGGWGGPYYYDGRIKPTSFMYNWAGKPVDCAVQYTYDNLGQLTSADNNLNNAWDIGVSNPISYDPNGNILDLTRGSTTKTYSYYPGTNKVKNTGGSGNDYGYDWNANVYYATPKSILDIDYDSFTQRPTSIYLTGSRSLALQYGGATQRVLKNYTDGSVTNSKLYLHGQNDYPLLEKDKTSAAAENLTLYIYGLNGAIAKRAGSSVLFLLKDHLGSTRVAMDATGLVHTYYDFDALGNIIRTGTTNEVTYQFTGQEFDESGLHNYRARMYDSDLGKFYATDPDEEFASPFIYAGNNALRYTDPTGSFISLAAFAFYAIQTYKYASYAYMAYNLVHATQQGGFGGFVQAAISMGAGATVGGVASGLIGSGSLAGSVASGAVGGAAGGAASSYVMGGNVGTSALMGAASGGVTGALSYGAGYHVMMQDFKESGITAGQAISPTQESLDFFIDQNESLLEMQDKAGNPEVLLATPKNTTGRIRVDKQGYIEVPTRYGNKQALGVTQPDVNNPIRLSGGHQGYKSTIRISKNAFASAKRLYLTIGHELTHAIQFYTGLADVYDMHRGALEYHAVKTWDIPQLRGWGATESILDKWFRERLLSYGIFFISGRP